MPKIESPYIDLTVRQFWAEYFANLYTLYSLYPLYTQHSGQRVSWVTKL